MDSAAECKKEFDRFLKDDFRLLVKADFTKDERDLVSIMAWMFWSNSWEAALKTEKGEPAIPQQRKVETCSTCLWLIGGHCSTSKGCYRHNGWEPRTQSTVS